ncbi:MAG: hypothetical protein ACJAXT_001098 [Paracoccaceae bacterium]
MQVIYLPFENETVCKNLQRATVAKFANLMVFSGKLITDLLVSKGNDFLRIDRPDLQRKKAPRGAPFLIS